MTERQLDSIFIPLKLTFGLVPLLAGLDKFVGLLADWQSYLSPSIAALLPLSPEAFMMVVGVVEMLVGLAVLTRFTRLGAYVAAVWLTMIAVNLAVAGALDVAVRDLAMAVAAYSLGTLAGLKGQDLLPGLTKRGGEWGRHASAS